MAASSAPVAPAPATPIGNLPASAPPPVVEGSGVEGGGSGGIPQPKPKDEKPPNIPPGDVPKNWEKSKLGMNQTGEVSKTQEVKDAYKDNLQVVSDRLRRFHKSGGKLTEEQKHFLQMYDEDGKGAKMMETEAGIVVAHLVVEQEMFLQLAAWQKKIEVHKQGNKPEKIKDEIGLDDLRGFLKAHGKESVYVLASTLGISATALTALLLPPVGAAVIGAEVLAGLGLGGTKLAQRLLREGKIKIEDMTIDPSRLPDEYQDYINYNSNFGEKDFHDFVFSAMKSKMKFYDSLGVPARNMEAFNPWDNLDLNVNVAPTGGSKAATVDLAVDWMRFMHSEYARTPAPADRGYRAAKFLEAHTKTLAHYADERMIEIKGEKTEHAGESISRLSEMRDALSDPEALKKMKTKKEGELKTIGEAIGKKSPELEALNLDIQKDQIERVGIINRAPTIRGEKKRLGNEDRRLKAKVVALGAKITKEEADFDAKISAAPTPQQAQVLEARKTAALESIRAERKGIETRIAEIQKSMDSVGRELARINELTEQLKLKEGRRDDLKDEIDELKRKKKSGEAFLDKTIGPKEKKKVEQLEVALQTLNRYQNVMSDLANSATKDLSVSDLTDAGQADAEEGFGQVYSKGYLKTLRLLTDYEHPPSGINQKEFFNAATELLKPDKLADLLAKQFLITIPTGPPGPAAPADRLEFVFNELNTNVKPSQNRFNGTVIYMLEDMEHRALRIS